MNRKYIYLGMMLFVLTVVFVEPTYCEITNQDIRGATDRVFSLISDWSIPVSIVCLIVAGLAYMKGETQYGRCAILGSVFVAGAKIYGATGSGSLLNTASQFFQM